MEVYYVYVFMRMPKASFYIGFTGNLRKRLLEHRSGKVKTTQGKPYKLVYFEGYLDKQDALGREKFLKGGSGRKYILKQLRNYLQKTTHAN